MPDTLPPSTPRVVPGAPPPAPRSTEQLERPQAHPTVVFDYTHLGPKGADLFAHQIADGLARAVPELRSSLIP